ncbi:MAG: type IX secretion system PorP/SprF family membrane protein [Flavobacteriales bacterium]|jgi:type IX secretion system PorP/SprF family membrane protein|tara:strand:+ start:2890 stop:4575 length:1686 start_codon:yes stop_codon:yes gene_type:complete
MIGKENIEEKIFEYFEGDLSPKEASDLELFIQDNPEYKEDFDAWRNSTVVSAPMTYKFSDELLVEESTSPKGWFKWASGGAFLFLISFASVSLLNNYSDSNEKIAVLKGGIEELNSISQSESIITQSGIYDVNLNLNTSKLENFISTAVNEDKILIKKTFKSENLRSNINSDLTSSKRLNSKKTKSELGADVLIRSIINNDQSNQDSRITPLLNIDKFSTITEFNKIFVASKDRLELGAKGLYSLKKSKYDYENPNQPKFFVTNFKDPYLNYSLAHILEENGSFAGNGSYGLRAKMLYRTEWPNASEESITSQIFSVDGYVSALKGGLGVFVNADRIGHGKLNSTAASIVYSPKLVVKGISLEPSFKYTYNQKSISWNQVEENDIKDPRNGVLYASIPFAPDEILKSNFAHHDLGLGMLINAKKFFVGAQVDHLNKPSYKSSIFDQDITIPTKISAMCGTDIMKNKDGKLIFSPSFNFVKFGNYSTLWTNAQVSYLGFLFAGGFATNEELMTSLGYGNKKVRLVYGLGFSKPSEFSGLVVSGKYYESHQLSLTVNLQPKKR